MWPKKSSTALRYFGHCSANRGRNDVLVCLPGRDVKRPLFGLALKKMARKWQKMAEEIRPGLGSMLRGLVNYVRIH